MLIAVNKFVQWEESYCLENVDSVAVTSDNKFLISGSSDKSIKVWNFGTKDLYHHFENVHGGKYIC